MPEERTPEEGKKQVFYNEDGDPVEGLLTPEEAEALKKQAEEKESELNQTRDRLSKLENKDFNFKRLRDMTEAERDKISAQELELIKRQEALEDQISKQTQQAEQTQREQALSVLVGDDEDMRKQVEAELEGITGGTIQERVRKAHAIVSADKQQVVNPIYAAHAARGGFAPPQRDKKVTPQQSELAKKFGISDDDLDNYTPKYSH